MMFCPDCHQTQICDDCINADLQIAAGMHHDEVYNYISVIEQRKNISSGEDAFILSDPSDR